MKISKRLKEDAQSDIEGYRFIVHNVKCKTLSSSRWLLVWYWSCPLNKESCNEIFSWVYRYLLHQWGPPEEIQLILAHQVQSTVHDIWRALHVWLRDINTLGLHHAKVTCLFVWRVNLSPTIRKALDLGRHNILPKSDVLDICKVPLSNHQLYLSICSRRFSAGA